MTIFHQKFYYFVALSHTDQPNLLQYSRLDLLQVTDSSLPHTDFWDDPLSLTIVPEIICLLCDWESNDASSSLSLRFMNRSRYFPQHSQLDLWRVCRVNPSLAGPNPVNLSSNAEISTVSQSGLSSLLWKCHCFTETTESMKAGAHVTHLKKDEPSTFNGSKTMSFCSHVHVRHVKQWIVL